MATCTIVTPEHIMCKHSSVVPIAPGEQRVNHGELSVPRTEQISHEAQQQKDDLLVPIIRLSAYQAIQQAEFLSPENEGFKDESSELLLPENEPLSNQPIEIQVSGELVSSADDASVCLNPKERKRAQLLSATIYKQDKDQKIGITFAKHGSILKIAAINKDGLLAESPFQPGDVLISINNKSCKKMSRLSFMELLNSTCGQMTLVCENESGDARLVESMVEKGSEEKTGLGLSYRGGRYSRVARIHADKLFSNSLLSRRDYILSVNGVDCEYMGSTAVARLVGQADQYVTVVAERKYESGVVVAMAA